LPKADPSEATAVSGRRRKPSAGDRREMLLLQTAARLLADRPWDSLTVGDLARGAGLGHSSFYFYFDSLTAVLVALAAEAEDWLMKADEVWLRRTDEPPYAALRRAIAANFEMWREHGPVLRAVIDTRNGDPQLAELRSRWSQHFVGVIAQKIENERAAGLARDRTPSARDLARALGTMTEGVLYEATSRPLSKRAEARLTETLALIWYRAVYGGVPEAESKP